MPAPQPSAPINTLFVYGTLMQGFTNPYARLLHEQGSFLSRGRLPGRLYRVSWYPAAVPDESADTFIYGEVFQLYNPDQTLPVFDEYEGAAPSGSGRYVRQPVVVYNDAQPLICWVYVYNASTTKLVPIESGLFTG